MAGEANVAPVAGAPLIRPATAADADSIGRVQVETWRTAYRGLLPDEVVDAFDVEARQRMWQEGLSRPLRPESAVVVAEVDGEVVGFASTGTCRDEDGPGELFAIYLDPRCWSTGVGRLLLRAAEEAMRTAGFSEGRLWVIEGNERAERFYRAGGWVEDGRKVDEFQGAEVVELRYSKRL